MDLHVNYILNKIHNYYSKITDVDTYDVVIDTGDVEQRNAFEMLALKRAIILCPIKTYLKRRKYGHSSSVHHDKVVDMSKASDVKIIAESPPTVNLTTESALAKANINSKVKNDEETPYSCDEWKCRHGKFNTNL